MRYLIVCLALFLILPAGAQTVSNGRRKHAMSRAFTEFTGENCFQITRQEADLAFRERSWDDAAALYRAAKSCADADQGGRNTMSLRIRACRDSAEQEVLDKERAARRQARQAIASNLADDAQDLLKNFDRGLAYRLADFANQYIAPEGEYNADCLQAMYDSWYYIPQEHSNLRAGFDSLRVPLCYQLPEDGSADGLLQFAGKGNAIQLYKFSPAHHLFYRWDSQTLRPEKPLPVDTAFADFQVSPDGRTVAFSGNGVFAFWQNNREIFRQKVPAIRASAFSLKSETFYYFDQEERKIMALDLRPKYVSQSRKSNANTIKPPVPMPVVSGLATPPTTFAVRATTLWLCYPDSVVICTKKGDGKPWLRSQVVIFSGQADAYNDRTRQAIRLFPEQELVLITRNDSTWLYQLPTKPGRYPALEAQNIFPMQLLGVAPDARMIARLMPADDERGNHLFLADPLTNTIYYGALTQVGEYFSPWQGTFSPDGRWFAAANSDGLVKLWALADRQSERMVAYGGAMGIARMSPDGQRTIMETDGKIESYPIPLRNPEWVMTTPDKNLGELVVADNWVAYFAGLDSLLIAGSEHRQRLVFPVEENRLPVSAIVTFDPSGKFVAYAESLDSVVVRRLPDGALFAKRAFSGTLRSLNFLPGRNALVIVVQNASDYSPDQNVIKIWEFAHPAASLSTVRLHDYAIQMIAVSPLGDYAAFSDGNTVRVFDLDKLDDEQASIHAYHNYPISSLAFQPDGRALTVGYNNGLIVFWDSRNAQFIFEFKNAYQSWTSGISQMTFAPVGNRLRYLDLDNNLFERQLDPDSIRATAQTAYKQLAAFSPDQILQYNLEPALSYDHNFEVLANSNDAPLIRSFFEFYRQQALSSNNIEQVGIYCRRAFELYKHLDQDFRNTQRQTMIALYEDYSWKWLLRNKIAQSGQVVAEMNRSFDHPIEAVRAGAFTALLDKDLPTATRLFVNWLMAAREDSPTGYSVYDEEGMLKKLRQLLDYDLLNGEQIQYLCTLFGDLTRLDDKMCPSFAQPMELPFDADTKLRWKILVALYQANFTNRYAGQVQRLEAAMADAQTLVRRHPESRLELEKTMLALANSYFSWGDFEQNNLRAGELYRRAIQLLSTGGKFHNEEERQDLLLRSHLALGDYLLNANQLKAAIDTYSEGIRIFHAAQVNAVVDAAAAGTPGILYLQRSQAELLLGQQDSARSDLEMAAEKLNDRFNPIYFGPIDWLENRTAEALAQYDDVVFDEQSLADARFLLQRLVEMRPETRARITRLDSAVCATVRVKYPGLDTLQASYYLSAYQHRHFFALGQWETALRLNEQALLYCERGMKWSKERNSWSENWLSSLISESFYLLFVSPQDPDALTRAIRYAERGEAFAQDSLTTYSDADLLKTNHAHALLLRDAPGDRAAAIALYRDFLASYAGRNASDFPSAYPGRDNGWEILHKDFRDLHAAGLQWPRLRELIQAIKPSDVQLSADEWREMGAVQ